MRMRSVGSFLLYPPTPVTRDPDLLPPSLPPSFSFPSLPPKKYFSPGNSNARTIFPRALYLLERDFTAFFCRVDFFSLITKKKCSRIFCEMLQSFLLFFCIIIKWTFWYIFFKVDEQKYDYFISWLLKKICCFRAILVSGSLGKYIFPRPQTQ